MTSASTDEMPANRESRCPSDRKTNRAGKRRRDGATRDSKKRSTATSFRQPIASQRNGASRRCKKREATGENTMIRRAATANAASGESQ